MNRRQYVAALAAALAGCATATPGSGSDGGDGGRDGAPDPTQEPTPTPGNGQREGGADGGPTTPPRDVELPIEKSALNRGAPKDEIPAIVDPAFGEDWSSVGTEDLALSPENRVIGVERDGEARAYPLLILNWHEIVNDTFGGPLLVTFCPLCGSGVTAERTVDGEETHFGVSGYLWQSDLVMYDEKTGSLWSQILAKAINGPKTDTTLTLTPSTITTWGEWQEANPETTVLLPPPESGTIVDARPRDYTVQPYGQYGESDDVGIGFNDFDDDRLHPKATVLGLANDGTSRAYPLDAVGSNAVVNDTVGGLEVVVTSTEGGSLFAYERVVDGDTLTFENADATQMRAGGSRWKKATGEAVDGPHEGMRLARANGRSQMFWFAWADFHPETEIYGTG